jgi:hypothetical protein
LSEKPFSHVRALAGFSAQHTPLNKSWSLKYIESERANRFKYM